MTTSPIAACSLTEERAVGKPLLDALLGDAITGFGGA